MSKTRSYLYCDGAAVLRSKHEHAFFRAARSPVILLGLAGLAFKHAGFYYAGKVMVDPHTVTSIQSTFESYAAMALGDAFAFGYPLSTHLHYANQPNVIDRSPYWGGDPIKSTALAHKYFSEIKFSAIYATTVVFLCKSIALPMSIIGDGSSGKFANSVCKNFLEAFPGLSLSLVALAIIGSSKLYSGRWKVVPPSQSNRPEAEAAPPGAKPELPGVMIQQVKLGTPLA